MSTPTAYRLFYRAKVGFLSYRQEVVFGEAELERCLKRQRPAVIHHERALLHKCGICKRRGPWTRTWRSMPQPVEVDGIKRADWKQPSTIVCSDECAERHWPGRPLRAIGNDDQEPVNYSRRKGNQRLLRARYAAFALEQERQAQLREHRKVPMFHRDKPEGFCRWCGEAVPPPRRTWHEECYHVYALHAELPAQFRFLVKRDGPVCKVEGCEARGTDVDHTVPLWSVRDLPDQERLSYYGPDNLQLLCSDHHKAKTAREAGERASATKSRKTGE